jgi:hypothetical protein
VFGLPLDLATVACQWAFRSSGVRPFSRSPGQWHASDGGGGGDRWRVMGRPWQRCLTTRQGADRGMQSVEGEGPEEKKMAAWSFHQGLKREIGVT